MGFSKNGTAIVFFAVFTALVFTGCEGNDPESTGGTGIAPSVTVFAPTGDSVLKGGAQTVISWTASDDKPLSSTCVTLSYGVFGNFTVIASGIGNTGSYTWTLPAGMNSLYTQVRVEVADSSGNVSMDTTDYFAVDSTPPYLTVKDPSPSSVVTQGTPVTIEWTGLDLIFGDTPFLLEYNDPDNGWTPVTAPLSVGTSSFIWSVPALGNSGGSTSAEIRVTATDAAGNSTTVVAGLPIQVADDTSGPAINIAYYGVIDAEHPGQAIYSATVGRADYFTVLWSEAMDRPATEGAIELSDINSTVYPVTVYWTETLVPDDTMVIVPDGFLPDGDDVSEFHLVIDTSAQDKAGNNHIGTWSAAFYTQPDTTGPQVTGILAVSSSGTEDLTNVVLADGPYGFAITFDEGISNVADVRVQPMMDSYVPEWDIAVSYPLPGVVSITLDTDGDGTYETDNSDELPAGLGFTLSFEAYDTTPYNNRTRYEYDFVIEASSAGEAPYITGMIPASGSSNHPVNKPIYLIFSEAIDPSTIPAGVEIKDSGGTSYVIGADEYTVDSGNIALIWAPLKENETFTVDLTTSLLDSTGTAAAVPGKSAFTFSTGGADNEGPTVFSCTVGAHDIDIDEDPYIQINMNEFVVEKTVNNSTVYIADAVTGVPHTCYDLKFDDDWGAIISMNYNYAYGSSLALDHDYVLCIKGVEDIMGNVSDVEIPFHTVPSSSDNSVPGVTNVEIGLQRVPSSLYGGIRGDCNPVTVIGAQVELMDFDGDAFTVTAQTDTSSDVYTFTDMGSGRFVYWTPADTRACDHDDGWDPVTGDKGSKGSLLFYDENTSGDYEWGEDIWDDSTGTVAGFYDAGDTKVWDHGDGWGVTVGDAGINTGLYFLDNVNDNTYDVGDDIWFDSDETGKYTGFEQIPAGPGVMTVTVNDITHGHTIEYDLTYFLPDGLVQHVSPSYVDVLTYPDDITFSMDLPNGGAGYADAVTYILITDSPFDSTMRPATVPLFAVGNDNSVDLPADFNLQPGWYFWIPMMFPLGYDIPGLGQNMLQNFQPVFIYEDTSRPVVSGDITVSGTPALDYGDIIVLLYPDGESPDTSPPLSVGMITGPGTYYIFNAPSDGGDYTVFAWRDTNGDFEPGDEEGGGQSGVFTLSGGDYSSADITLTDGFFSP